MDIKKNKNLLILSMIIFYGCSIVAFNFFPDSPEKLIILVILDAVVALCYFRLHFSMYFDYQRTFMMAILVLLGTFFTNGTIGFVINVYCIRKASEMLKAKTK